LKQEAVVVPFRQRETSAGPAGADRLEDLLRATRQKSGVPNNVTDRYALEVIGAIVRGAIAA